MSRTGVEAKLPWKDVPQAVRQQVERALGAPVRRAARIWGGYTSTPTYRLALADGRRAFFKGTYQLSNMVAKDALLHEERVYRDLGGLLEAWMPRWYTSVYSADWHGLLLEDLGPRNVPPWTSGKARAIMHALAAFHRSTLGTQLPAWLSRPDEQLAQEHWGRTVQEADGFTRLAPFAGAQASQLLAWFEQASPMQAYWMQQTALREGPAALLHGDLRSDNLRYTQGRLILFDWPAITVGRPEWDCVAFVQSITVEAGPPPEQLLAWYEERFPLENDAVACALAWWLTYFAHRAWRADIPGLPRVRRFQRQQLAVLASWAARQWSLPAPEWSAALLAPYHPL